ncbi:MAG: O-antigen ligase family protein [Dehalococcoidia bacterium]|nr:O-antigen ligase family protein [Dehalococcoidia bacterium]
MTQRQTNSIEEFDTGHLLLWTVRAGILLIMAMPFIVSSDTLFPFIVGKAIYARSVIEVTFGIWLLLIFFYPRYRPSLSLVVAALGVWLLVSLIAGLTGVSTVRSLWSTYERMQGIVDLAHWFVFIAMTGSVFRSLSDWRILFTVNLIGCMAISFLGINQHYGIFDMTSFEIRATDRIESTLGNATYVGAYTMVNALIALSLIIHSLASQIPGSGGERSEQAPQSRTARRRRRGEERRTSSPRVSFNYIPWLQSVWVLSLMLNIWALWLTGTRGAVVGLGTTALVFSVGYLIWGRIRVARIISYALVASAVVVIGLFAAVRTTDVLDPVVESNTMLSRISSIGLADASISGRVAGAQAGLLAYAEKPALGWGPENFLIAWGKHVDAEAAERDRFDQAHNKLVEELTTKGTLGFVSYMLVWVAMAWAMFRSIRRRRGYEQLSVLIIAATMLAYFVQNLFLFDTPVTLMQFSLLAAFAVAQEYWAGEGERKRAQSWMPEKLRGRLSLRRVTVALRASWGAVCLMALVSVVVIVALYALNLQAYNAAADIASFGLAAGTVATWEERLVHAEDSISTFPGLANYPRRHIIRDSFDRLPTLSDEEFWAEVELMESTGNDALDVEPDNWRIIAMLVLLHQTAAERDNEYVAKAREGLDKMAAIAPNLPDTRILTEQQYILEQATATP